MNTTIIDSVIAMLPDDAILKLDSIDRAYIAGLFDGEGCFRIGAVGRIRTNYYPMSCIAMTNLEVIQWLTAKLQSGTVKIQNYTRINEGKNWKIQHAVHINGKRAQILCYALLPYLKVKRKQAELILQFPSDVRFGPRKTIPSNIQQIRTDLKAQMHVLNKRGIR